MFYDYKKHLILKGATVFEAMSRLNDLALDAILFVIDSEGRLIGSLTDGDIRRGLLSGKSVDAEVLRIIQPDPKFVFKNEKSLNSIIKYRKANYRILPVLDDNRTIVNIINFRIIKSYLPVDALIMAGGRGERLRPLTDETPKPMLKVGEKPILEHNIDRLAAYGVDDIWISLKYLGHKIEDYFGDGLSKNISIKYLWEDQPLGTLGALGKIDKFHNPYLIVMNSDLLTNTDFEDFFLDFVENDADMSVLSIPYDVTVPYAVLQAENERVKSFVEKPTYTYYSNGGVYLMKTEVAAFVPKGEFFNATDLIDILLLKNKHIRTYSMRGYWLDIGKHDDYKKAQEDIKHIKL
jgi:dTDP-glucose pyrophosphorylase